MCKGRALPAHPGPFLLAEKVFSGAPRPESSHSRPCVNLIGEGSAHADPDFDLVKQVSPLLESMNQASTALNICEMRMSEGGAKYKKHVERFGQLYRELRCEYGRAFDDAKPYFDAAQKLKEASRRLRGIVEELSSAPLEEGARHCERYARTLQICRQAKDALDTMRARVGEATIKHVEPGFQLLELQRVRMAAVYQRLDDLSQEVRAAKQSYLLSMRALEDISNAVHTARREIAAGSR